MEDNKTVATYYDKLKKCGISEKCVDTLKEKYGKAIESGSFSTKNDCGLSGEGTLIGTVLRKLTVYAVQLNNLYPESIRVNVNSIVKVCLLQHLSKSIRTEKSTNEWRIKNLGEEYVYTKNTPSIGTGLHSLMMAVECGIELTPFECEAMVSIDRDTTNYLQLKYHSNMLSAIVYQANQMTYVEAQKVNNIIV